MIELSGRRRWLGAALVGAAAAVLAVACGGDDATVGDTDAGADAGADVTLDAASDAGDDVNDAAPLDTGADTSDGAIFGTGLDGGACGGGPLTVTSVDPPFASTQSRTAVTVTGTGFAATPTVYLRATDGDASGQLLTMTQAAFVDATSMNLQIPLGTPTGTYDLAVVDPNGCAGVFHGFKVVANPVPVVLSVSPATGTTQSATTVTVTGCDFPTSGATLSVVASTGAATSETAGTVTCDGVPTAECARGTCTMTGGSIGTTTLADGAYLVRVGNTADGTYGDYASFVVTNPSAKLSGGFVAAPALVVGRRSHATVAGRIDDARRFVYAIGGENAAGAPLASVEVAPVDKFGKLGKWFVEKNALPAALSGVAAVRQGRYLYVIGGTTTTGGTGGASPTGAAGAQASIERAKILDPGDAPELADPAIGSGGALAAGTFYYEVSAILSGADPDTAGETVASNEVVAAVAANGAVTLTWNAVPNATGYRVYRSAAANDPSGTEVLLADGVGGDGGSTVSYVDTGAASPGTERPVFSGSTGPWRALTTPVLTSARFDAAATIAPDPTGALHLYVAGGWGTCPAALTAGVMNCVESTTLDATGATIGAAFAPDALRMAHARMRFGLTAMSGANGPAGFDSGVANTAFLVASGGPGLGSTGDSVEYTYVGAAGALAGWSLPGSGYGNERDGSQLYIVNGYAYAFMGGTVNGGAPNYTGTTSLSTNATIYADAGTPALSFGNWSSASANLGSKLGRHGVAQESAYFYVVGGTSNDADALTSVYQILY